MIIAILYGSTFVIFLGLDYLGLSYIVKPVFEKDVKDLLHESPRLGPALMFYAFYIAVLLWFVSWPAIQNGHSLSWVFASAALLGAMAYGTYEFTNLATIKGWTWRMVVTDLIWGTLLTGTAATAGVFATRAVATPS